MKNKKVKVIFDTNVLISFLIGKRLAIITRFISDSSITIILTDQLLIELSTVTRREKLKKYFSEDNVNELIEFLKTVGKTIEISPTHFINRDPKDNFLLDLIDFSKADYLVTGDKDLLLLNPFKTAAILTPKEFEKELKKHNK